ncbi:hypothetical protein AB5I41_11210 [Sphingomonas sp. MMS24-JH45]
MSETMRALVRRGPGLLVADVPDAVPETGRWSRGRWRAVSAGRTCMRSIIWNMASRWGCGPGRRTRSIPRATSSRQIRAEILDHGPGTERRLKPGTRVVSTPFAFGPVLARSHRLLDRRSPLPSASAPTSIAAAGAQRAVGGGRRRRPSRWRSAPMR